MQAMEERGFNAETPVEDVTGFWQQRLVPTPAKSCTAQGTMQSSDNFSKNQPVRI
jgi:hypothetical protein